MTMLQHIFFQSAFIIFQCAFILFQSAFIFSDTCVIFLRLHFIALLFCFIALLFFGKALLFNFSKCKQALIFYSSKYETVSNSVFQNINQLLLNFLCKHTISWSYFFIIFWIILNMFQMLVLIMYKTSRFLTACLT
jgi:hypothetical protein